MVNDHIALRTEALGPDNNWSSFPQGGWSHRNGGHLCPSIHPHPCPELRHISRAGNSAGHLHRHGGEGGTVWPVIWAQGIIGHATAATVMPPPLHYHTKCIRMPRQKQWLEDWTGRKDESGKTVEEQKKASGIFSSVSTSLFVSCRWVVCHLKPWWSPILIQSWLGIKVGLGVNGNNCTSMQVIGAQTKNQLMASGSRVPVFLDTGTC